MPLNTCCYDDDDNEDDFSTIFKKRTSFVFRTTRFKTSEVALLRVATRRRSLESGPQVSSCWNKSVFASLVDDASSLLLSVAVAAKGFCLEHWLVVVFSLFLFLLLLSTEVKCPVQQQLQVHWLSRSVRKREAIKTTKLAVEVVVGVAALQSWNNIWDNIKPSHVVGWGEGPWADPSKSH